MKPLPGTKVLLKGREKNGFAEIDSYTTKSRKVNVSYYSSPFDREQLTVEESELIHSILPNQTKCFGYRNDEVYHGRVIVCQKENVCPRSYYIKWPNQRELDNLDEDTFRVKAYNRNLSPVSVLSQFSYETPFFFDQRYRLLKSLYEQNKLCEGLTALPSIKVEFFDHQVEIAKRVLQDPIMRYLLADEVGLGKTIEAGMILRQVTLDCANLNIVVFTPITLVRQWKKELSTRFGLNNVMVFPHELLLDPKGYKADLVVIDEAHRIVGTETSSSGKKELYSAALQVSKSTRHLLLLSATPVLNKDTDLLALLHLLDPNSYQLDDLNKLRKVLKLRQEIGKTLLALSKARLPLFVKKHAMNLKKILNTDPRVAFLVEQIHNSEGSEQFKHSSALKAHISESYRLNRRMIKTRRSWLSKEFGLGERKVEEQQIEYSINEELMAELWGYLEDWRIEVSPTAFDDLRYYELYMELAQSIAFNHKKLSRLLKKLYEKATGNREAEIIEKMISTLNGEDRDSDRIALICLFIEGRLKRDKNNEKYIVFCSSKSIVLEISERVSKYIKPNAFQTITTANSLDECEYSLDVFENEINCRFLIADSIIEEGVNLQFAEGFILFDLPWDPMRLEQRFGRLDRINRISEIPCWTVLSAENDSLAFDEVWYNVLRDGFGIFRDSLSDLQFLIDKKMPQLLKIVFEGGPEALWASLPEIKDEIDKERELIEEQDVIDGLSLNENSGSQLRENLDEIDIEAETLSKHIKKYLEKNLKFKLWWIEDNIFYYKIKDEPLLPVFRLENLIRHLNIPTTNDREVANKNFDLQLLLSGSEALSDIQQVLEWDERGKVFAMCRFEEQCQTPFVVFRVILKLVLEKSNIEKLNKLPAWDQISQNGLLRLISSWLPNSLFEIFFDEKKEIASEEMVKRCFPKYKTFSSDTNLGGLRSIGIKGLFEGDTWKKLCNEIGQKSIDFVKESIEVQDLKSSAIQKATEHFDLLSARLETVSKIGMENNSNVKNEIEEKERLFSAVIQSIENPKISIDTMGVYIFSNSPIWETEG